MIMEKLKNIKIEFGGNSYPSMNLNVDFTKNKFIQYFNQYLEVAKSLGYVEPHISIIEYKNLYPTYAFDLSNIPESIEGGDCLLSIEKDDSNATSYQALVAVLLENIIEFSFSDRACKFFLGITWSISQSSP